MLIGSYRFDHERIAALEGHEKERRLAELAQLRKLLERNPLLLCKPHQKQAEFLSVGGPGHRSFFLGGNRSGKSEGGAIRAVINALHPEFVPDHLMPYKRWGLDGGPVRGRIVTVNFKQSHEIILSKIQKWVPRDALRGGGKGDAWWGRAYDKDARKLWFKNGSFIEFMSQEQDPKAFQGQDLHWNWFDEEPLYEIGRQQWSESMARLIDYDGEAWMTMTPLNGMLWVYDDYFVPWENERTTDDGEQISFTLVSSTQNPYVSERGLKRYFDSLGVRSVEEMNARKHGLFISFEGLIYKRWDRAVHVMDSPLASLPKQGPERRVTVESIDPGARWPVVEFGYADEHGRVTLFDELTFEQGTPIEEVCAAIKLKRRDWGYEPTYSVIDPAAKARSDQTGRSTRDEYARHGVHCRPGNNAVTVGIGRGNVLMSTDGFFRVSPSCREFVDEVRKYRWKKGKRAEDAVKEAPVKRDDHALDAARYLWMSLPEPDIDHATTQTPEWHKHYGVEPLDASEIGTRVNDPEGMFV